MRFRTGPALCLPLTLGLMLALGLAGCGGGADDDGVATADGAGTATPSSSAAAKLGAEDRALKFAQCMRENGIPNFKDPQVNDDGEFGIGLPDGVDKETADAAQEKCKQYVPSGGEHKGPDAETVEKLRQLAKCMRANGVPDFPDPEADGHLEVKLNAADPAYQAAEKVCAKYQPSGGSNDSAPGPGAGG